jgi:hypothetical protein
MRFVLDEQREPGRRKCIPFTDFSNHAAQEQLLAALTRVAGAVDGVVAATLAKRAVYVLHDVLAGVLGKLLSLAAAAVLSTDTFGIPDLNTATTEQIVSGVMHAARALAGGGAVSDATVLGLYPQLKDLQALVPLKKELQRQEKLATGGQDIGFFSQLRETAPKDPTEGSEYSLPRYTSFTDAGRIPYTTKILDGHRIVQKAKTEGGIDPGQSFDSVVWCQTEDAFAVEIGLPALPPSEEARTALEQQCKQHCHRELSSSQGSKLPDRSLCPLCLTYVSDGTRTNSKYLDMVVARNGDTSRIPPVKQRRKVWSRSMSMDISTDTGASKSIDEVASARENFLAANPDIAAAYHARTELLSLVRRRKKDADFLAVIGEHFRGVDQLQKDVNAIVAGETKTSLAKEEEDDDDGPEGEEANAAAQLKGVDRTLTAAINAASKGDDRKLRRIVDAAKVVKDVAEGKPDEV